MKSDDDDSLSGNESNDDDKHHQNMAENDGPNKFRDQNGIQCPQCHKSFSKQYIVNRHLREVHNNPYRKTLKHIHDGQKVLCPICREDFTHSSSLKRHIIKFH